MTTKEKRARRTFERLTNNPATSNLFVQTQVKFLNRKATLKSTISLSSRLLGTQIAAPYKTRKRRTEQAFSGAVPGTAGTESLSGIPIVAARENLSF